MDPPTKKQCLTQQFLKEVTRKEGLGWEANLAAHVSKILLVFTTFLNPPYFICIQENHEVVKL